MQKSFINSLIRPMLIAAGLALAAPAQAAAINWDHSFLLQGMGVPPNPVNPLVRIGFEQSPGMRSQLTQLDLGNRSMPRLNLASPDGSATESFFDVFFAIALPAVQLEAFPPDPVVLAADFESFTFDVFDESSPSNPMFSVVLGFETSGGGKGAGGAVILNPQPEVPSLFGFSPESDFGLNFNFTSFSDLSITLQVFDAQGAPLSFSAVPEPGTILLLGFGLAGCAALRRRNGGK